MSLMRLAGGAGLTRLGGSLMRRGFDQIARAREAQRLAKSAPFRARVSGIQAKTRGAGATPQLFSKKTGSGQRRRLAAATRMRDLRAGRPSITPGGKKFAKQLAAAHHKRSLMSARSKVATIHRITRGSGKFTKSDLSKKTGKFTRSLLATDLKKARQGPHTSSMFGYVTKPSPKPGYQQGLHPRTLDLRRKRTKERPSLAT